jgi:hypothetical protein
MEQIQSKDRISDGRIVMRHTLADKALACEIKRWDARGQGMALYIKWREIK